MKAATTRNVPRTTPARAPAAGRGRDLLLACGLLFAVVVAYLPAIRGEFLWNDRDYVTAPHLRSAEGLARIWFEVGATEQYYPLLHSAFWVQHRLWGDTPMGYHLALVLEHALAALLFLLVLRRLQVPGAWLAAWIFALHPVMVESAGWISEQKNTLSILFYLVAALGYLRFDSTRSRRDYALATLAFTVGLMAKTTTAMLPVALWAVLLWRRGWRDWTRDLVPLAPWLVIGAAAGLFSGWVEKHFIGADGGVFVLEPLQRLALSGRITWFYLGKLVWPFDLIFVYPRWEIGTGIVDLLPTAAVLATLGTLIWRRHHGAGPVLVAALYFGALLFPVMGFLNIYFFRFSYVGDHFQYLASLGPIALIAAALTTAAGREPLRRFAIPAAAVLVAGLGALTWRQSAVYVNNETLWRTTLDRNPRAVMAWLNLGDLLTHKGDYEGAIHAFKRALELRPTDPYAHNDIAGVLLKAGRPEEAIAWLERSAKLDPLGADPANNLGLVYSSLGRHEEAIASFRRAVQLRFVDARSHGNLGTELALVGRVEEAATHLGISVRLRPNDPRLHANAGDALRRLGRFAEAMTRYGSAIALDPASGQAHAGLGLSRAATGDLAGAVGSLETAVRLLPDSAEMRLNLGVVHAQAGDLERSLLRLREATELAPTDLVIRRTLADALAYARRGPEAIAAYEELLRRGPADADLLANLGALLAEARRPADALVHLQRAVALRPRSAAIHHNLAQVFAALGRPEESSRHASEARRLQQASGGAP